MNLEKKIRKNSKRYDEVIKKLQAYPFHPSQIVDVGEQHKRPKDLQDLIDEERRIDKENWELIKRRINDTARKSTEANRQNRERNRKVETLTRNSDKLFNGLTG